MLLLDCDMINLLKYFPEVSPVQDLTIILDEDDYFANNETISNLNNIRVDSLKGRNVIQGIEVSEKEEEFLVNDGFTYFAIHGHTEGKDFCSWQMFDKSRFELNRIRKMN